MNPNRMAHLSISGRFALLRRLAISLAALALAAVFAGPAWCQTTRTFDLASFYQTDLRALAMGNAFGPVARGEAALLYNPAGLVQYNLDVKLEASLAAEGERGPFFSDTLDQLRNNPSPTSVRSYLDKYNGTTQDFRLQKFYNGVANLAAFNFGLGAGKMDQQRYQFQFNDGGAPGYTFPDGGVDNLTLSKQRLDISFFSLGFALLRGKLLVGGTYKRFTFSNESATQFYDSINNIDLTLTGPSYDGTAYDVGFIYRVEWLSSLRPQWSVVVINAGGVTMTPSDGTSDTLEVPTTYNVGLSFNPNLVYSPLKLLVSAEVEDVAGKIKVFDPATGTEQDRSLSQRTHYGLEVGFWEIATGNHVLNARLGWHRGRLSRGAEINLWHGLRAVYTRYSEDFGFDTKSDVHEFEAYQVAVGFGF